jgi:hypothetical protein
MRSVPSIIVGALIVLLATSVSAQTIAGTARDESGAVLPGVTVEVASPA